MPDSSLRKDDESNAMALAVFANSWFNAHPNHTLPQFAAAILDFQRRNEMVPREDQVKE